MKKNETTWLEDLPGLFQPAAIKQDRNDCFCRRRKAICHKPDHARSVRPQQSEAGLSFHKLRHLELRGEKAEIFHRTSGKFFTLF